MLTIKELYDFLHEKGVADDEIDLVFSYDENPCSGNFELDKEEILKTWGDCEVEGIDIFRKQQYY
jgi:hypothetical protein